MPNDFKLFPKKLKVEHHPTIYVNEFKISWEAKFNQIRIEDTTFEVSIPTQSLEMVIEAVQELNTENES